MLGYLHKQRDAATFHLYDVISFHPLDGTSLYLNLFVLMAQLSAIQVQLCMFLLCELVESLQNVLELFGI